MNIPFDKNTLPSTFFSENKSGADAVFVVRGLANNDYTTKVYSARERMIYSNVVISPGHVISVRISIRDQSKI